jgi:hypothetical protein
LVCGLVSKPIGGGNSKTVTIKIAIIAPTAPFFVEEDVFIPFSILDILPNNVGVLYLNKSIHNIKR